MNLLDFYSYRLIGKLTSFLHLQEFSQRYQTWGHRTSTFAARRSLRCWSQNVEIFLPRHLCYVLILISTGHLSPLSHIPIALANFSIVNLVSIFRCSSSTVNPVYERHVTSLVLVCSLSSHRHSYTSYLYLSLYWFIINNNKSFSSINVRCSSSTIHPVYTRRVDSSSLIFSLSSPRHSYIGLDFSSLFID